MENTILELKNLNKSFGETHVLRGINLSVGKGEFITLLGSSGCGKTTTLRIIAGLETADSGSVFLEGTDISNYEPNKRNVNTVFQNYALFPHLTVAENIGYSLKIRNKSKAEIKEKVAQMLKIIQLEGYEKKMPSELSGGQAQRVAIGRSIISEPEILLLDEPLGALDLQLRRNMQTELKKLQKQFGITFVYITHDQEEAINMSDRIAVMRNGLFEQIGTPYEIYTNPKTAYVARFVGSSNILHGEILSISGNIAKVSTSYGVCLARISGDFDASPNQRDGVAVRGENIELNAENADFGLDATVAEVRFYGSMLHITLAFPDGKEIVAMQAGIESSLSKGDCVKVSWRDQNASIVDGE